MKDTTGALKDLRELMKDTKYVPKPLDAYIVHTMDAHFSEYTSTHDNRREFISGFTGSAGIALILQDKALLWTDGRYYIQAARQLDKNWTLMKQSKEIFVWEWVGVHMPPKSTVGICGKFISLFEFEELENHAKSKDIEIVTLADCLIDVIWKDQPPRPANPVFALTPEFTGKTAGSKLQEIREEMAKVDAGILVASELDEVAWTLNLRGLDVDYCPVFFSFMLIYPSTIKIFMDGKQVTEEVKNHLSREICGAGYEILEYDDFYKVLKEEAEKLTEGKVWLARQVNQLLHSSVPSEKLYLGRTPMKMMKATKNEVEMAGMRNAHVKDCVALACFFSWLDSNLGKCSAISEFGAAKVLRSLRAEQKDFVDLSFETICCSGPHAAIIHYFPTEESDVPLLRDEVILLDSGGSYKDGTTDITRTIHLGTPTPEEKLMYTLVLKGNIEIQMSHFPKSAPSSAFDTMARRHLWEYGLDYLHGTGHGIGHCLFVHEGPVHIGLFSQQNFEIGMVTSDEPGYYEEKKYGFRIEDVLMVQKSDKIPEYLMFENISLIPYERNLMDLSLLTEEEIAYINAFHEKCRCKIGKALEEQGKTDAKDWLYKVTEKICSSN